MALVQISDRLCINPEKVLAILAHEVSFKWRVSIYMMPPEQLEFFVVPENTKELAQELMGKILEKINQKEVSNECLN